MKGGWAVWQNPAVASNFQMRRGAIPGAEAQLETLAALLPPSGQQASAAILDVGCGDGVLLEAVTSAYPHSTGVGVDCSPWMIEQARSRFENNRSVSFIERDFNEEGWTEGIEPGSFLVVVSGFAIHHVEDDRKQAVYRDIFRLLRPGGVFINTEHVASVSPRGEALFESSYARSLCRIEAAAGSEPDYEELLQKLRTRPDKAANRLAPVEQQLCWLREIGYTEVDCYWKHYELAILAGYKPS